MIFEILASPGSLLVSPSPSTGLGANHFLAGLFTFSLPKLTST